MSAIRGLQEQISPEPGESNSACLARLVVRAIRASGGASMNFVTKGSSELTVYVIEKRVTGGAQ